MVFENLQPHVVCEIQHLSNKKIHHVMEVGMWSTINQIYSTNPNIKDSSGL